LFLPALRCSSFFFFAFLFLSFFFFPNFVFQAFTSDSFVQYLLLNNYYGKQTRRRCNIDGYGRRRCYRDDKSLLRFAPFLFPAPVPAPPPGCFPDSAVFERLTKSGQFEPVHAKELVLGDEVKCLKAPDAFLTERPEVVPDPPPLPRRSLSSLCFCFRSLFLSLLLPYVFLAFSFLHYLFMQESSISPLQGACKFVARQHVSNETVEYHTVSYLDNGIEKSVSMTSLHVMWATQADNNHYNESVIAAKDVKLDPQSVFFSSFIYLSSV